MSKEFQSFLKTIGGNEATHCHYPTRLDTYGCGCQHNCAYCYARSLLDFRGLWNPAEPAVAPLAEIRKAIGKMNAGDIVRLGGMTDCFQPLEREKRVTLRTIEMLNKRGVEYLIVTKSALIAEAEYLAALNPSLAHIQVSITSTDANLSRRIEPGASLPAERIAALETLAARGFDASVRLSPFVPEFVDMEVINAIRCDKILVEFLRVNTWIRKWLTNVGGVDLRPYRLNKAGYSHLPLRIKREYIRKITGFAEVSVCEDYEEHWTYWQAAVNANFNDCCNLRRNTK